jgi:hypothetical protein
MKARWWLAGGCLLAACGARTGFALDDDCRPNCQPIEAPLDATIPEPRPGPHVARDANVTEAGGADVPRAPDAEGTSCPCALGRTRVTPTSACADTGDTPSLGCEFWPTSLANPTLIHPFFDELHFGIAVSNPGAAPADFEVIGPCGQVTRQTLAPGASIPVVLPWMDELKYLGDRAGSVRQACGAYRLVSSRPVTVTQFNPFEGAPLAHSNDASRLTATASLGTRYRAAGYPVRNGEGPNDSYLALVGVADDTQVTVRLGPRGSIRAGRGVVAVPFGGTSTFSLGLGDVVELVAAAQAQSDFNGTPIESTKPVAVLTGHPCALNPDPAVWCDHLEESLAPVSRLGNDYVVPLPSHPLTGRAPVGHSVIFVGDADGTDLTYAPAQPPGAPAHLSAGEVVDVPRVTVDFEVHATRPFVLLTMMLGSAQLDTVSYAGDPSFSVPHDVGEFRTRYLFFAPPGYDTSFADIVAAAGADVLLDGAQASAPPSPIAGTGFVVQRLALGAGAHILTSPSPLGVQVVGYSNAQSYAYPATGTSP